MYMYDDPSASSTMPSPAAVGNPGYFTDGSAAAGVPATILRADFMNALMLELINIVNAAGITLDKTKTNQVITALQALFMTETTADARYALLNGADVQIFKVANAAANDEAVNLGQADARYAALAGLASQVFSVANASQSSHALALGQIVGSLTANGYIGIPILINGVVKKLYVQWGTYNLGSLGNGLSSQGSVTLPLTYPTAHLATVVSPYDKLMLTGMTGTALNNFSLNFANNYTTALNMQGTFISVGY